MHCVMCVLHSGDLLLNFNSKPNKTYKDSGRCFQMCKNLRTWLTSKEVVTLCFISQLNNYLYKLPFLDRQGWNRSSDPDKKEPDSETVPHLVPDVSSFYCSYLWYRGVR
jgi:hypothetical protein